ncbi:MAG TPA: nucleotidyltransferase domain-containing protein [Thermoanaerobaculia bacterium]
MKTIKIRTDVPEDRILSLRLPDDVAAGPTELVVLVAETGPAAYDIYAELPTLPQQLWSREDLTRHVRSDSVVRQLADALVERLGARLEKLVLFGSRARGDHRSDSDYDCLAVVAEVTPEIEKVIDGLGGELLVERGAVVSIFPVTKERFESEPRNSLFQSARDEGIVLWPRPAKTMSS